MCHCHFLYDSIYYSAIRNININRLIKQHKRSFKRRKSASHSLYSHNLNIDENFCPYTRRFVVYENEGNNKKKLEIGCPMEETCADTRIMNEFFAIMPLKKNMNKYEIRVYNVFLNFHIIFFKEYFNLWQ